MSTYYEFYIGRDMGDKIEAIGPYIRKDGEYKLTPLLSRSRSFICWDEFDAWQLDPSKLPEDQIDFFTEESWSGEERRSLSYIMSYYDVADLAEEGPTQGYVTLDELDYVASQYYAQEALYDIMVRTTAMIAEMDPETRKNYGHIAFTDRNSTGYICMQLINSVDPVEYDVEDDELCFIIRVC